MAKLSPPKYVLRIGLSCKQSFILLFGQSVGAEAIIDAVVYNTPIFVRTSTASNGQLGGSLVLNNIELNNVPVAVGVADGTVVLPGGTFIIDSWVQGNVFSGSSPSGKFTQSNIAAPEMACVLLDDEGKVFGKTHPQYADYDVSHFVSVRDQGATGDGKTDDTDAIEKVLKEVSHLTIYMLVNSCSLFVSTLGVKLSSSTTARTLFLVRLRSRQVPKSLGKRGL